MLPNSVATLVLGILSIVTCPCYGIVGVILGIIALVISKKSIILYKETPELYEGYGNLNAGRIMAIIGVSLGGVYILFFILYFIFVGYIFSLSTLNDFSTI